MLTIQPLAIAISRCLWPLEKSANVSSRSTVLQPLGDALRGMRNEYTFLAIIGCSFRFLSAHGGSSARRFPGHPCSGPIAERHVMSSHPDCMSSFLGADFCRSSKGEARAVTCQPRPFRLLSDKSPLDRGCPCVRTASLVQPRVTHDF
jgi:hypothetical protein